MIDRLRNPIPTADLSLYGGADPRDLPRYSYKEASRASGVPSSTVASWVRGMPYSGKGRRSGYIQPLISRPSAEDSRLSFHNVVEVHNLRCLRFDHNVRLETVRRAIELAQDEHGIKRLLIHPELRTSGGELFLDKYFDLVQLSGDQQYMMREMMRSSLGRLRVDANSILSGLSPISRAPEPTQAAIVLVSPFISFGDAIIERRGVSTLAIAARSKAGESAADIIRDYRLTDEEFGEALYYEAAA